MKIYTELCESSTQILHPTVLQRDVKNLYL